MSGSRFKISEYTTHFDTITFPMYISSETILRFTQNNPIYKVIKQH